MKVTAIEIENVRGFLNVPKLQFSEGINIFIGPNNSGKSTLLYSVFMLQRAVLNLQDITLGKKQGNIILYFDGNHPAIANNSSFDKVHFNLANGASNYGLPSGSLSADFTRTPEVEPNNLIYPYLSKRKTATYDVAINESNANSVTGNFYYLNSKIDRLITPEYQPGNEQYVEACKNILGFVVSSLAKGNGKQAVYIINNLHHIPLTSMGEGVANILGLLIDLCVAENKIFLIEEPENDIHPNALKGLLKLIIEKSNKNQFFISTHSNIVMKYLGGVADTKIYNVTNNQRDNDVHNLFISQIDEVSNDPEIRRQVLEDLGYDFFDFDLWKGWLFLEESSSEIIIRDYLIDWFVRPLKNRLRTFSAGGISGIIPKFEDFDKLFIFLHLEPTYKNKVWVLIDAGLEEQEIIQKMKSKYSAAGWNESNFNQFYEHDFEKYYPAEFQPKVKEILLIENKQEKRNRKKALLDEVINWINSDIKHAKEEFNKSAQEVIDRLKQISADLNK